MKYLRVDIHVLLQTDSVAEGFSADVAAKRSRSTVRPPDVDLQSVRRWEHLKQSQSINVLAVNRYSEITLEPISVVVVLFVQIWG